MPTYDGLNLLMLGPVALTTGPSIAGLTGQQGHVLALLAAAQPNPVDIDTIVDDLWPDRPPRTAETGLRVVLTRLRRRLTSANDEAAASDRTATTPTTPIDIINEGGTYRLVIDEHRLDHRRFATAVTESERLVGTDPDRASDVLIEALELWRGPAFQPYGDATAIAPVAAALDLARLDAEEQLVDALLRAARPDAAASWATRFVETGPYRERRWEQLMLALYRSGRQSEALQAGHRAASVLREDLGIEPGAGLRSLEHDILDQAPGLDLEPLGGAAPEPARTEKISVDDFVSSLAPASGPTLPPGGFFGRDEDEAELVELIGRARLVSIVGPPGVGKTRLARHVTIGAADRRTVWLDLLDAEPDSVVTRLAAAINLRIGDRPPGPAVAEQLAVADTLLVFDNCEHLVGAVAELAEALIPACPGLTVLTTSRTALQSPTETVYTLEPLEPDDATRLLRDRLPARAASQLTDRELRPLVDYLDGLPLSLELTAPTLNVVGPEQLAHQLATSLDSATGRGRSDHRHRSLDAAVAWSVDLLDPADRELFESLGVLHGTYATVDVAGLTGRPNEDTEPGLSRLASAGLVRTAPLDEGTPGWTQLNVVRSHARGRLSAAGRLTTMERDAAQRMAALIAGLTSDLEGADEDRAVARLRRATAQIEATHRWLVDRGDPEPAAAFGLAVWNYSFFRQDYAAFGRLGEIAALDGATDIEQADELFGQASLAAWATDRFEVATVLAEQADRLAEDRGRPGPLAAAKTRHLIAVHEGDRRAGPLLLHLVEESGRRSEPRNHADNLTVAAIGLSSVGAIPRAMSAAQEALALAIGTGNPTAVSWARVGVGMVELSQDPARAARTLSAGRRLARTVDNRWVGQMAITGTVTALRRMDRRAEARRLLAEVVELWSRANSIGQVWRCCQEAILLLDADGETERVAELQRHLAMADHVYPVMADERERFDAIARRLGATEPSSAPEPGGPPGASGIGAVARLVAAALRP